MLGLPEFFQNRSCFLFVEALHAVLHEGTSKSKSLKKSYSKQTLKLPLPLKKLINVENESNNKDDEKELSPAALDLGFSLPQEIKRWITPRNVRNTILTYKQIAVKTKF